MSLSVSTLDLTIVAAYLLGVVAFGIWVGRGKQDLQGYLLGGRDMPWWAVLGSIVATETSTATFLSVPGIAFNAKGDFRFLQLAIGYIVGRMLIAVVLLPQYFRGELFTAYEVLDKRFGGATKRAASMLFLVARNLGDGLRLFLTAIVLEQVVGLSLPLCIAVIGAATIVYTLLGGMKAVVWNDCIQFVVYMLGGALALWLIIRMLPDGWSQLREFGDAHHKWRLFDFRFSLTERYTFWAGLFGGAALTLGTHGTDQMMVQRYLCTRGQRDAGWALVASGFVVFGQFAMFLLLGVALACFYATLSPHTTFASDDEVFATFIVRQMPVGLVGLTLAAVFSAAMSTLSSSLNSSAASAVNDLYRSRHQDASPNQLVNLSRVLTIVFGIVQIVIGIAASYISRSVVNDALAIAGFTAGILLGVFLLGVLTERARQQDALTGLVAGVCVLTFVKFATSVAWPWYAVIGAATTFAVGYACSLLRPEPPRDKDQP